MFYRHRWPSFPFSEALQVQPPTPTAQECHLRFLVILRIQAEAKTVRELCYGQSQERSPVSRMPMDESIIFQGQVGLVFFFS